MDFSFGENIISNERGDEIGKIVLSEPQSEFGSEAPFYFGQWIAVANLEIYPPFRGGGYAKKIMKELIRWAESSKKTGILLRPTPTVRGGFDREDLEFFYKSLGFRRCDTSPNLMEKKLSKPMVLNLFAALKRLGLHKEAANLEDIIRSTITEDSFSVTENPITLAVALRELGPNALDTPLDEFEINTEHVQKVLDRAGLYGFGGECAEAAIAINDVLFNEEGKLVAAVNKWLWENEGRAVGHIAVEWNGEYWDAKGKKDWVEIESWGMVDESEFDSDLEEEEKAYSVRMIYLSKKDAIQMFGDCNLKDMIKKLEKADREIRDEEESG